MAGLLGDGWEDPRSNAMMALSAGLLGGSFKQGLLGASNAYAQSKQDAFKQRYMDMQIQEMQSQVKAREMAAEQAKRKQTMIDNLFGVGGVGAPVVSPGAFEASPSQAGPMGPTMPPEMAGLSRPGSRMANLGFDQLAALKANGMDLTELHKYANDPLKMESGSTYQNRVTGQREYMPKLPEGMAPGANGQHSFVPGYAQSVTQLEADKAGAVERAKAGQDLVKVVGPDGAERWVTRAQAVQATQPPPQPQPRQMAPQPQGGPQGSYVGDPQVVIAAINDIRDPVERQRALQAYEQQYGPLQATPTTAQKIDAARQTKQMEADVRPTAQRQAAADESRAMLSTIQMALNHPGLETGTGLSGKLDPRNYVPGTDAKNFSVLMDQIKGKTFLQAFESLKGAGQITEVEGKKATDAIARLNTAQSTSEFKRALRDLQEVTQTAQSRQGGASGDGKPQAPTVVPDLPKNAPKGARARDTVTGEILTFNGLSWVKAK